MKLRLTPTQVQLLLWYYAADGRGTWAKGIPASADKYRLPRAPLPTTADVLRVEGYTRSICLNHDEPRTHLTREGEELVAEILSWDFPPAVLNTDAFRLSAV